MTAEGYSAPEPLALEPVGLGADDPDPTQASL
jgi:hypothetical protein